MSTITNIFARQILDSRGTPTVEVEVHLESGAWGRAAVPSGASTGRFEAVELRDQDPVFYNGKSVLSAVHNINTTIAESLRGMDATDQLLLDQRLQDSDQSDNKSLIGANATLGTSMAVARAAANYYGKPLHRYLGTPISRLLPMPMLNVINGGAHADNSLTIQEFMIVPMGADSFSESLSMSHEVIRHLRHLLIQDGHVTAVGDEGGFAPNLTSNEEALDYIVKAIETANFIPGEHFGIALDIAASEIYKDGKYKIHPNKEALGSDELVSYYGQLISTYPILSIEDGMDEEDWEGWQMLTAALNENVQLVGDDLFVTNPLRLLQGITSGCANAILIKPNQIGTVSETLETIDMAAKNGYATIISHRSGETEDTFIADLAVAVNAGQIKTGSLCRTDRIAKYNQLLRIEEQLGEMALFNTLSEEEVI